MRARLVRIVARPACRIRARIRSRDLGDFNERSPRIEKNIIIIIIILIIMPAPAAKPSRRETITMRLTREQENSEI